MARPVKPWVGKTDASMPPPRVRLRVFLRYSGICQLTGRAITPADKWQLDHKIALINGGRNAEDNLWPVLAEPHKEKTKADLAEKAKVAAVAKRHLGIKPAGTHKIENRGFAKSDKPKSSKLPVPQRTRDIFGRPL